MTSGIDDKTNEKFYFADKTTKIIENFLEVKKKIFFVDLQSYFWGIFLKDELKKVRTDFY